MFYPKGSDAFTAKLELQPSDYHSLLQPSHLTPRVLQLATFILADENPNLRELGMRVILPPQVYGQDIPTLNPSSNFPDAHDDWKYLVMPTRTLEGAAEPERWNLVILDRTARAVILLETDWKDCKLNPDQRMVRQLFLEKEGGTEMDIRFSLGSWSYRLVPSPVCGIRELNDEKDLAKESGVIAYAVMQQFVQDFVERGEAVYPESWRSIFAVSRGQRDRLYRICCELNPTTQEDNLSQERKHAKLLSVLTTTETSKTEERLATKVVAGLWTTIRTCGIVITIGIASWIVWSNYSINAQRADLYHGIGVGIEG